MQQKEREKAAIIAIAKNSKCYDYRETGQIRQAYSLFRGRAELRMTEFGTRYLNRLKKLMNGSGKGELCILCGKNTAVDGVLCQECLDNIHAEDENLPYEKQIENMQYYLTQQMRMETKRSAQYTDDIVRNLDSSMDRLATQSSMKATNRMVAITLALCCINTFGMLGIFILLLFR